MYKDEGWEQGTQRPTSHFRPRGPLSVCWGKADGVQKTLFFSKRSQLPPQRQADTGDRGGGSHRGHTHTTRRQIIQDTILTVLGMAPKRQPEGRSLRNWGQEPSGAAVHLSLGVGRNHQP